MSEMQGTELDTGVETDSGRISRPFGERAENVLAETFRGIHHIKQRLIKKDEIAKRWEYNHENELSTYDYDELTRFVLSCHKWGIRGTIGPSSPRHIRIILHPRVSRDGHSCWQKHPTLQDAISKFERSSL